MKDRESVVKMRLDYTLYALAALLLIITILPFVVTIEGVESDTRNLWMVATIILGLLSIGLGYSQRPKTEAQACQPAKATCQGTKPLAAEKIEEEKTSAPAEKATVKNAPKLATPATRTMELTQVKGIGEKRSTQLKALGINNVENLSKASANTIAKKLNISPKIVARWIASAEELGK
jgi:predicted flap endonuclease-1-like 5' DNA nuclease